MVAADQFVAKKNQAQRVYKSQKENINKLNNRCIKLEKELQLKTMSIGTLHKDVGTISLVNDENRVHQQALNIVNPEGLAIAVSAEVYGAAVLLCNNSNVYVVIKVSWIRNFSKSELLNSGRKSTTKYIVFYSTEIADNADFTLSISSTYSRRSALYKSNIFKFFGK